MSRHARHFVISWVDQQRRSQGPSPTTREYGSASTKQAAIRLAERVLPPDADSIVTTITRTVHAGRTPPPAGRSSIRDSSRRR